jgi:hypothetical protein
MSSYDNALGWSGLSQQAVVPEQSQYGYYLPYPAPFEKYDTYSVKGEMGQRPIFGPSAPYHSQLGKLVGIPEPAGKLRIIAICDGWTQSLFEPLHDELFKFLRRLPNDGTLDQDASYERGVRKGQESGLIYCADLSAATDRLPKSLQVHILNELYPRSGIGTLWGWLLDRDFHVTEPFAGIPANTSIRYGVGQPMGCLSSWAMLAICHHFILQSCCSFVGMSSDVWQTCYEILGDDIVIFNKDVYHEYVRVMDALGVETNPHKSLISESENKVMEFAKRTSLNGVDVSGLSWKLFDQVLGWKDIIPLILHLSGRHLIKKVGLLRRLMLSKYKTSFSMNVNLGKLNSKKSRVLHHLTFSLMNYFSRKGMIDSVTAYSYVFDPRKGGDRSSLQTALPLETAMQDVLLMLNKQSSFRELGWFDSSLLKLGARTFRAHLVEAMLLPYWGHDKDFLAIKTIRKIQGRLPTIVDRLCELLTSRTNFGPAGPRVTPLDKDLYLYFQDLIRSLIGRVEDDTARAKALSEQLQAIYVSKDRSIDRLNAFLDDLSLFSKKFDLFKLIGKRKDLDTRDSVPWTLTDVGSAIDLSGKILAFLEKYPGGDLFDVLRRDKERDLNPWVQEFDIFDPADEENSPSNLYENEIFKQMMLFRPSGKASGKPLTTVFGLQRPNSSTSKQTR